MSTVKALVSDSAVDIACRDNQLNTPLIWAAGHGQLNILKVLLATGRANLDSEGGKRLEFDDPCYKRGPY